MSDVIELTDVNDRHQKFSINTDYIVGFRRDGRYTMLTVNEITEAKKYFVIESYDDVALLYFKAVRGGL